MSRLHTVLNQRIHSDEFGWELHFAQAASHSFATESVYRTSQGTIGLRLSLMKKLQWVFQNVPYHNIPRKG